MDNYKIKITKHAKERMIERKITQDNIILALNKGTRIDANEIRIDNICVIYDVDNNKNISVITVFTSRDIRLNEIEEPMWLELYFMITNNVSKDILNNKFIEAEQLFNKQTNKIINLDQFLHYDDSLIITQNNKKVIVNTSKNSLLTIAIKSGNINAIDILLYKYNIALDKPYENCSPYSPIHSAFKSLDDIDENKLLSSVEYLFDKYENVIINSKEYGYTLLHRTLFKGLDKLSCYLINKNITKSLDKDNRTKYNENIYDLIKKNKDKLFKTNQLVLELNNTNNNKNNKNKVNSKKTILIKNKTNIFNLLQCESESE